MIRIQMIHIPLFNSGYGGDDAMMRQLSVAVRPPNHYVQSLGVCWVHFIGNCYSVTLMGAVLSVEDLGFESPQTLTNSR